MNRFNNTSLRIITVLNIMFALPLALFVAYMGAFFTDGEPQTIVGVVMGLFTLVIFGLPAIICIDTLHNRAQLETSGVDTEERDPLKMLLWIIGFVFLTIPTAILWLILRTNKTTEAKDGHK